MARSAMARGFLLASTLLAATLAPSVGHAAIVEFTARGRVDVFDPNGEGDPRWEPAKQMASAGDTLVWHFGENAPSPSGVQLNLEVYATDGEYFAYEAPTGDITRPFPGGTVWFRSRAGSGLTPGGVCSGACGSYTSLTIAPGAPVITSPAMGAQVGGRSLTVSGTGQPFTIVRLMEGTRVLGERMIMGDGTWSIEGVQVARATHTFTARLTDAVDRVSPVASTTFDLIDDGGPIITVDETRTIYLPGDSQVVSGSATDPSAVASVDVRVFNTFGTLEETTPATCAGGCEGSVVDWEFDLSGRLPGIWELHVLARDVWGNESTATVRVTKV
ncbi:MAG TPA: hypothetical protein VGB83_07210 [Actinomycetota bacterium]